MFPMPAKRALITGITGQDGSYLSEWLLRQGYEVHGIVRRVALEDPDHRLSRLREIRSCLKLHAASLESYASIHRVVDDVQPDECYHLAAQSFVSYSFDDEFSTLNTNINGTHFLLATLKSLTPRCRFYFAGSSEMFGMAETVPQTKGYQYFMYGFGSAPMRYEWNDLPREILGEGIVINVNRNSSTMIITFNSIEVYAGDYIEIE